MYKKFIYLLFSVLLSFTLINTHVSADESIVPEISADAAFVMEATTNTVIYEKNPDKRVYPASTTKIITAMVAIDHLDNETPVSIPRDILNVPEGSSTSGLRLGDNFSLTNIIRALMIPSGNDAAIAIAANVARRDLNSPNLSYPECEEYFADLMNKKAKEYGALNTNFVNPHGFHSDNHYTTARDMALISKEISRYPLLASIASEKNYIGNSLEGITESPLKSSDYSWASHNELIIDGVLHYPYATGLKTGYTPESGNSIVATASKDNINVVATIMNSPTSEERFNDSIKLFDYTFENYSYHTIIIARKPIMTFTVKNGNPYQPNTVDLVALKDFKIFIKNSDINNIVEDIFFDDSYFNNNQAIAPTDKSNPVANVKYSLGDKVLTEDVMYFSEDIDKTTFLVNIKFFFKEKLSNFIIQHKLIISIIGISIVAIIILILLLLKFKKRRRSKFNPRKNIHF